MSKASNGVKLVYGAAGLSSGMAGDAAGNDFHAYAKEILSILKADGIDTLDTAEIYTGSEEEIGYQKAAETFIIDTKIPGGWNPGRSKEDIVKGVKEALVKLNTKQVCSDVVGWK
jgi:aflatoxin B1 aldehyde reductase